ncbi:hypothetical protein V6N13_079213 [Hibiscus sabdariffa]
MNDFGCSSFCLFSFSVHHNVQELELNFCTSSPILTRLPVHVFSCKTLLSDSRRFDLREVEVPYLPVVDINGPSLKRITVKGQSTETDFLQVTDQCPDA